MARTSFTVGNGVTTAAVAATAATIALIFYTRQRKRRRSWSERPIARLPNSAKPEDVVALLRRDGVVIVENLAPEETVVQLQRDILSLSHTEYSGVEGSFAGQHTKRCGPYMLSTSSAARQLAAHPLHIAVSEELLGVGRLCRRIRLSVVACIRVFAGQRAQVLHRDDEEWPLALLGRIEAGVEIQCSAMWAATEFRDGNGATNVVVGSHGRHGGYDDPEPPRSACQMASMPAGSVLFFTGSAWHGAGAASEGDEHTGRMGFVVQHIAGYLHPEYNLHFAVDPKISATFSGPLRSLLGFDGPDLFPNAELPGPVYATGYTGWPEDDPDFSAPISPTTKSEA